MRIDLDQVKHDFNNTNDVDEAVTRDVTVGKARKVVPTPVSHASLALRTIPHTSCCLCCCTANSGCDRIHYS